MTDLPAAAITAARKRARAYYVDNISMMPTEREVEHLEALTDAALEAAAPHLAAAERQRIRLLATEHRAHVWVRRENPEAHPAQPFDAPHCAEEPFADLLDGQP